MTNLKRGDVCTHGVLLSHWCPKCAAENRKIQGGIVTSKAGHSRAWVRFEGCMTIKSCAGELANARLWLANGKAAMRAGLCRSEVEAAFYKVAVPTPRVAK